MVIHGHVENGVVIPNNKIPLPNRTEVTIIVRAVGETSGDTMSAEERDRYLDALAEIDAVANENPGDSFRGADHDRVLYGDGA